MNILKIDKLVKMIMHSNIEFKLIHNTTKYGPRKVIKKLKTHL